MSFKNWKTLSLGDICVDIFDGPHATPKKIPEGPIFLGISNLSSGRIDLAKTEHLSEKDFTKWTRRVTPQPNDLVFSYETRLGEAALIPEDLRCCLGRRMGLMRFDTAKVDPKFMLYAYLGPKFQQTIQVRTVHGSTVDRISLIELPDFPITIPSLPTQRRIADILSALDDKIELNRQTNATLESMAQAIFKEWFVHFNYPGATGERVESELGPIPAGWRVGKIKDFTENVQYGFTQSASMDDVGPHFLRITDIQGGYVDWSAVPYCLIDDKSWKKYAIKEYDIVIARTGASTGENTLIVNPPISVFASYLIRIQFIEPKLAVYVGKLLRTKSYFEYVDSIKSGSAQPNANAQQLTNYDMLLPSPNVLEMYYEIVKNVERLKAEFQNQSTTIARIRDTLLPKLMRGEIEV